MGKYLISKLFVAVTTSIALSVLLAINVYTPLSDQRADTLYWSFIDLMIIYLIYSLPVIIIGGIPISILINRYISFRRPIINFFMRTSIYALSGAILFYIFLIVISKEGLSLSSFEVKSLLVGVIGAVLFYWIDIVFRPKK